MVRPELIQWSRQFIQCLITMDRERQQMQRFYGDRRSHHYGLFCKAVREWEHADDMIRATFPGDAPFARYRSFVDTLRTIAMQQYEN